MEEAICILFVLRKKQFLYSPSAAVVVISMASASQYDSRRMVWYGKTLFKHASLDQRKLLFMRGVTQ